MGRQVERLTLDNLPLLPGPCSTCAFWELDPVRRAQVRGHEAEEKAAWLSGMLREWGRCGRVVRVDDRSWGTCCGRPRCTCRGAHGFATAPVSADAVLLATGYVEPEHRGQGLGRVLVQAMAKDLVQRGGIRAVEAFGGAPAARAASASLPADFLLAVGFRTHRSHPAYPRMRMDLATTVTWREELETALDRLLGVVGASAGPRPDGAAGVTGGSGRSVRGGQRGTELAESQHTGVGV